jgi:hypothetical protein
VSLSREEILDYAGQYVDSADAVDFPVPGELFCILARELPPGKSLEDDEGWQFGGYGVCRAYRLDEDVRPQGKWLWFEFASLMTFPPHPSTLRLQPPHVVKGRFHSPDRSQEFRIVKVGLDPDSLKSFELHEGKAAAKRAGKTAATATTKESHEEQSETAHDNVVAFPRRKPRAKKGNRPLGA